MSDDVRAYDATPWKVRDSESLAKVAGVYGIVMVLLLVAVCSVALQVALLVGAKRAHEQTVRWERSVSRQLDRIGDAAEAKPPIAA